MNTLKTLTAAAALMLAAGAMQAQDQIGDKCKPVNEQQFESEQACRAAHWADLTSTPTAKAPPNNSGGECRHGNDFRVCGMSAIAKWLSSIGGRGASGAVGRLRQVNGSFGHRGGPARARGG